MIFPETLGEQAEIIAERIRYSFQEVDFGKIAPEIPKVIVSIGVTTGEIEETKEEWIRRTDKVLYRAKNEEKKRVMEG